MLRLVVTISFLPSRPNVLINNLRASSLVMHAFDFFHAQFEKHGWMGVGRTPSRKLNPRWLITVTYATIPILRRVWDILWWTFSNVILGRAVSLPDGVMLPVDFKGVQESKKSNTWRKKKRPKLQNLWGGYFVRVLPLFLADWDF